MCWNYIIPILSKWYTFNWSCLKNKFQRGHYCFIKKVNHSYWNIFQPWNLFGLGYLISSSLISKEFTQCFVLYLKTGNLLRLSIGVHWAAKHELKSPVLTLKPDIKMSFTFIGAIFDIFGNYLQLTLIRLGFLKVVFSGGSNWPPLPFIFQEVLI